MTISGVHLSEADFSSVVEQAISRIPEELRKKMENILVTIKPRPDSDMLSELGYPPETVLFGVYLGVPLPERSPTDPPLYPDTIYIFQEPLEAYCRTREELIEEIEITVVHEIAHFLGFDDDDLQALGYG